MDFSCSPIKLCGKFRRLPHYEELAMKAQHNEIELAKCIKNEYSFHLTNEESPKHQRIIATKCIQDLWRWIHEIGIVAVRENEYLRTELNEMKSIQSRHYSQQSQWEHFCAELKNENKDLRNDISRMKDAYDAMVEENRDLKQQNEILLHQYQETIDHLDTERHSMVGVHQAHKQKMKELNEIKAIISSALKEDQVVDEDGNYANISNENADHDTIALLCQIIKNQDQRLIAYKNPSDEGVEGIGQCNLELSDYSHQHYAPCARDGEGSCNEMQAVYGEYDDDVNEYKYKLHKLFAKYKLSHDLETDLDLDSSLDSIERVCKEAAKYHRAYASANKQIQKLKHRHRLGWKMSSKKKKQQVVARKKGWSSPRKSKSKPRIIHHKKSKSMNSIPSSMAQLDPMQILSDIAHDLLSLMKYLQIVQNKNQYEYCVHKIESFCISLQDLANDIGSPLLQNAVNILKSLKKDIVDRANLFKFNNELLHDVINKTKNTISDLYDKNMISEAPSRSVVIDRIQCKQEQVLSESLSDIMVEEEEEEDYDVSDAPFIQSIQCDEHWSNKAAKAVIVYKGKKYKRNMKAFEWLSKVLMLSSAGRNVPKFAKSICRKEWDINKRRRELNRYLKECHDTKWIRHLEGYHKIFFAKSYKEWKVLRTKFDRNVYFD